MTLPMEPKPADLGSDLTPAQHRELEKITCAPNGHPEGKGPEWSVRTRLQSIGLLELRKVLELRPGNRVRQHDKNTWFVTGAGHAVLRQQGALASNRSGSMSARPQRAVARQYTR